MKHKYDEMMKWMQWAKANSAKFLSFEETNNSSERSSYQSAAESADGRKEGRPERIRTRLVIEFEYDVSQEQP